MVQIAQPDGIEGSVFSEGQPVVGRASEIGNVALDGELDLLAGSTDPSVAIASAITTKAPVSGFTQNMRNTPLVEYEARNIADAVAHPDDFSSSPSTKIKPDQTL